jgi:dihydrolipoamide dehydrogenase
MIFVIGHQCQGGGPKSMAKKITVIGAGPGGYVAAIRAAQLGAEVTIIERENVGGTCLNWGCIPSKVMKTTAELLDKFHRSSEFGITVRDGATPNMKALMRRKQTIIQDQIKAILTLFEHHKIQYLHGVGRLEGPHLCVVKLIDGSTVELPSDGLILASGSEPLELSAFPFDGKHILSSNDALELVEIPDTLLIVGGGVIGCEFAFIFSALGSRVTLVEGLSRLLPLPSVDEGCSKVIQREMKKRKIEFMVNKTVEKVERIDERLHVTLGPSQFMARPSKKDLKPLTLEAAKILVCIGRQASTAGMGLEKIGVKVDNAGWIAADEHMETGVPRVYAVGDVLGPSKVMLAHVATREGLIAAENLMGSRERMEYAVVPNVIFTTPEVANVGLTEAQAKEQDISVRSDRVLFRNLGKPHVLGEIAGETKIISHAENGKILGVHMVGPHASDLIAEGTLAVKLGCTVKELAGTIHAHPTLAEVMMETSFKALDRPMHG